MADLFSGLTRALNQVVNPQVAAENDRLWMFQQQQQQSQEQFDAMERARNVQMAVQAMAEYNPRMAAQWAYENVLPVAQQDPAFMEALRSQPAGATKEDLLSMTIPGQFGRSLQSLYRAGRIDDDTYLAALEYWNKQSLKGQPLDQQILDSLGGLAAAEAAYDKVKFAEGAGDTRKRFLEVRQRFIDQLGELSQKQEIEGESLSDFLASKGVLKKAAPLPQVPRGGQAPTPRQAPEPAPPPSPQQPMQPMQWQPGFGQQAPPNLGQIGEQFIRSGMPQVQGQQPTSPPPVPTPQPQEQPVPRSSLLQRLNYGVGLSPVPEGATGYPGEPGSKEWRYPLPELRTPMQNAQIAVIDQALPGIHETAKAQVLDLVEGVPVEPQDVRDAYEAMRMGVHPIRIREELLLLNRRRTEGGQ